MCREFARAVGELWRIIGDAFSPYRPELHYMRDAGARPFLRAHPDLVALVECGDTGRPDDIDTPEDLVRVAKIAAQWDPAGPY